MLILFVHGMGRTPISATPMLWRLRRHGHSVDVVGYFTGTETFAEIANRVSLKIQEMAEKGEYVLIGHSLGGLMLRAALQNMPKNIRSPKHLFLLGSPVSPARLAQKSQHELGFQLVSGDCGQLLASAARLSKIPMPSIPKTAIVGTRSFPLTKKYFLEDENDGVVSVSECAHQDISEVIKVPVVHTFLPSSRKVSRVIVDKISDIQSGLTIQ
ncbi:alpha/beta hydrolase [Aliiglaciecola sp. 3_MG-2023]|uniref:esterase/lipase family protein n=1 Tax=Aliiglaciecola sp. 3_MG-2023 TaxID=3062644 RepID=UPI0026E1F4CE|nr:alpha/beta hydrolase [Aliiglaciecola sp. 3_MG-2023]MDO6692919.1 alpha/beta hydrolase [Aliiglaciecola sp. 3_MG-2023]